MEKAASKKNSFRYERKFVVAGFHNRELESMIRLNPALFSEIHYQRQVNNIYFDTHDFKNYRDNIDGCAERIKVRIRWYGELFGEITRPVLEYKIKSALVGGKESYKLQSFCLDSDFTFQTVMEVISRSEVPEKVRSDFKNLQPTLLNCYTRRYFLSANKQYRLTLDQNMEYYKIRKSNNFFVSKFKDHHSTIIELKYSTDADNRANLISSLFPFRMTKSSKYVNGIDRFYGSTV